MKIIDTSTLTQETPLTFNEAEWIYNGLDSCVTLEVLAKIKPQLTNTTRQAYEFSKDLQAPVLEMNIRGIRVDKTAREEALASYRASVAKLEENLSQLILGVFGLELNWRSNPQLHKLFYELMKIPPIKKRNQKGLYVPSMDREALEKLSLYFYAKPFVAHLLRLRDLAKKVSTLETEIDFDGRMRTSYNIAGTTTFRFSSSLSEFGTGGNLQNIEERLRRPFVADPGMKLCYIDLEQAESRGVGAYCWNLFGDATYLDACESGDLHTTVCRLAWTDLPWTGDLKKDREIAEQPFYRQHSYRHMAKVLGHGSNYNGKPYTMALHTKLEASLIKDFQENRYFKAFPAIRHYHQYVRDELRRTGRLVSLTGHQRDFFGRRTDDSTIREGIAFGPQCSIGVLLNQGLLKIWKTHKVKLLLQIHDAVVFQYPEELENEIVPEMVQAIRCPIELRGGRQLIIPSEAKVGWNWASYGPTEHNSAINPFGLMKFKGSDSRKFPGILDRVV